MQSKKTAALDMMSFGLLVALAAACGESDTASTGGGTGDASTTSAASTTSGVASTGGLTTGEPATSTPATTSSGDTTSDGSATSASSSSGESTTSEAASSGSSGSSGSSSGSSGSTGGDPPPLTEYCDCMLSKCHDQYHMKFGEDHVAAEMMCLAYAESIPTLGMPAESGASIECYYWACTQSDCTSAFGGGVCQ